VKRYFLSSIFGLMVVLFANSAQSQTSNFSGLSVGINGNFSTAATELSYSTVSANVGDTSQNLALQASYGIVMGSTSILSIGGTYALNDLKAGTATFSSTTASLKAKNIYTIHIEPGTLINRDTLLYAKLAYAGTKGEASLNSSTSSSDFNGVGYGAGSRIMMDKSLFLQIEFMQLNFNSISISGATFKPNSTLGTVGFIYKF
jgi:hypothetical protein